jgi:hypothetical protein
LRNVFALTGVLIVSGVAISEDLNYTSILALCASRAKIFAPFAATLVSLPRW